MESQGRGQAASGSAALMLRPGLWRKSWPKPIFEVNFLGTFGSCGAATGYLGNSAGALGVSGGYLGSFWEAVRKLTRTWRDLWEKLWRALS